MFSIFFYFIPQLAHRTALHRLAPKPSPAIKWQKQPNTNPQDTLRLSGLKTAKGRQGSCQSRKAPPGLPKLNQAKLLFAHLRGQGKINVFRATFDTIEAQHDEGNLSDVVSVEWFYNEIWASLPEDNRGVVGEALHMINHIFTSGHYKDHPRERPHFKRADFARTPAPGQMGP
jgi:hypothetical protein